MTKGIATSGVARKLGAVALTVALGAGAVGVAQNAFAADDSSWSCTATDLDSCKTQAKQKIDELAQTAPDSVTPGAASYKYSEIDAATSIEQINSIVTDAVKLADPDQESAAERDLHEAKAAAISELGNLDFSVLAGEGEDANDYYAQYTLEVNSAKSIADVNAIVADAKAEIAAAQPSDLDEYKVAAKATIEGLNIARGDKDWYLDQIDAATTDAEIDEIVMTAQDQEANEEEDEPGTPADTSDLDDYKAEAKAIIEELNIPQSDKDDYIANIEAITADGAVDPDAAIDAIVAEAQAQAGEEGDTTKPGGGDTTDASDLDDYKAEAKAIIEELNIPQSDKDDYIANIEAITADWAGGDPDAAIDAIVAAAQAQAEEQSDESTQPPAQDGIGGAGTDASAEGTGEVIVAPAQSGEKAAAAASTSSNQLAHTGTSAGLIGLLAVGSAGLGALIKRRRNRA